MPAPHFDYLAPATLDEAIQACLQGGKKTSIMAGGTDLVVRIRHGMAAPKRIVSLKQVPGLDRIAYSQKKGLTIGAMALLADVAAHRSVRRHYPTVAQAAEATANVQVRNMGTVVGNLCNASPSADNAPTLMALGARMQIQGPDGSREQALEDFFRGPGITTLGPGEIVTAVQLPVPPAGYGSSYHSLSQRGKLDCSAVGVGAVVVLKAGQCNHARIVVGACAPVPLRTPKAEAVLEGQALTDESIRAAADKAAEETTPISDVRASADYRFKMVSVLTRRALFDARKMAGKNN